MAPSSPIKMQSPNWLIREVYRPHAIGGCDWSHASTRVINPDDTHTKPEGAISTERKFGRDRCSINSPATYPQQHQISTLNVTTSCSAQPRGATIVLPLMGNKKCLALKHSSICESITTKLQID